MSKKLVLEHIRKNFGSLVAVNDVNLIVEQGEFLCFLGPSGCGKTTLLRIITGFERATSGTLSYAGRVLNNVIPQKRDFGIVFQSYALFPNMTVAQNIAFGLKMRNMPQRLVTEKVNDILKLVGLSEWHTHYPAQLSGGQQQRVALGRAIAIKPNVLLLDEPLSALDAKIRVHLRTAIKRLQQELGITMIYVTHDQEEALSIADRVAVMKNGQINQIGSPWEIYKEPKTSFVAQFVGTSNFISATRKNGKIRFGQREFLVSGFEDDISETVHLAIRPEKIELVTPPISSDMYVASNVVDVVVEVITFLGAVVQVTFTLEGEEMHVDVTEKTFEKIGLQRGEKMTLYFPPDAFHAYTERFEEAI